MMGAIDIKALAEKLRASAGIAAKADIGLSLIHI